MSIVNLTPSQLRQAANLVEKIAGLKKQVAQLLGAKATPMAVIPIKKKGGMSAAGKARISAAAKLRWAKIKAAKAAPAAKALAPKPVVKVLKKRIISPAARAKMAAAAKAMWAAKKAKK
jgi:hypothetical protein